MDELNPSIASTEVKNDSSAISEKTKSGSPVAETQSSKFSKYLRSQNVPKRETENNISEFENSTKTGKVPPSQLAIHRRSQEIGRVIITAPQLGQYFVENSDVPKGLNDENFLTRFFGGDDDGPDVSLVDHIRATMIGEFSRPVSTNDKTPLPSNAGDYLHFNKPAVGSTASERNASDNLLSNSPMMVSARREISADLTTELIDSSDVRGLQPKEAANLASAATVEQKFLKQSEQFQLVERASSDIESGSFNTGQRSSSDSEMSQRENAGESSEPSAGQENQGDEYDNWRGRLAALVEEKISIAVQEGLWTVKLNLQSVGLNGIGVSLSSSDDSLRGRIYAPDPEVKELLLQSVEKLEKELGQSLAIQGYKNIRLEVVENPRDLTLDDMSPANEIKVHASELLTSITTRPKADDGFDVFV